MVVRETVNGVELSNGVVLSVNTSSFRSIRGRTFAAIIMDELAYWLPDDAIELLAAARTGMTTIPWAKLIGISTKYMAEGPFYDEVTTHWGNDSSSTLVVQATSQEMNPTLPDDVIAKALAQDPERAAAEYLNQWRSALAGAYPRDKVDGVLILVDRTIPPPDHPYWNLLAFADISGGVRDAAALSVAAYLPQEDIVRTLLIARWPAPHSPASVIKEMAELLRQYGFSKVVGDAYAAQLTIDMFAEEQIHYERSDISKSQIYLELVPLITTTRIEGPNNETLRRELLGLQRRTRSGGRDLIDHAPGSQDDKANAFAGAAVYAWRTRSQGSEIVIGPPLMSADNDSYLIENPWDDSNVYIGR